MGFFVAGFFVADFFAEDFGVLVREAIGISASVAGGLLYALNA
jgi:hypothetical protein